jgi:hypothetical protein
VTSEPTVGGIASEPLTDPTVGQRWQKSFRVQARNLPWLAITTFLGATIVALLLIDIGAAHAGSHSGDLFFELAKAGIQLLAIVFFGGAVAAAFRSLDARRDDRRRLDEYRASMVGELLDAYHRAKAVRRNLRAAGFRGPTSGSIAADQIIELRDQMRRLDDAQLTLEKLAREVETQLTLFHEHGPSISASIRQAEKYLRVVLRDWEKNAPTIKPDAELARVAASLPHLSDFVGSASADHGLGHSVSKPVEKAASLIQSLRFGTTAPREDPNTRTDSGSATQAGT